MNSKFAWNNFPLKLKFPSKQKLKFIFSTHWRWPPSNIRKCSFTVRGNFPIFPLPLIFPSPSFPNFFSHWKLSFFVRPTVFLVTHGPLNFGWNKQKRENNSKNKNPETFQDTIAVTWHISWSIKSNRNSTICLLKIEVSKWTLILETNMKLNVINNNKNSIQD